MATKKTPHLPVQGTSLFNRTTGIPYTKGGRARPAGRFTRGGFNFGGGSNR